MILSHLGRVRLNLMSASADARHEMHADGSPVSMSVSEKSKNPETRTQSEMKLNCKIDP